MNSNVLADAVDYLLREKLGTHSLLVVRNGCVVLDACFYPFAANQKHDVASVTSAHFASISIALFSTNSKYDASTGLLCL